MNISDDPIRIEGDPENENGIQIPPHINAARKKQQEVEKAIEDLFYPGAGGYPMIEAGADFRTLTGVEPPINPKDIVNVLIQLQLKKLPGGEYCIFKFLHSQPTMGHVKGIEEMIINRIGSNRKRIDSETYLATSDATELRDEMDTLQDILGVIHRFFMSVAKGKEANL